MKTCTCGGMWYRHGKAPNNGGQSAGIRYRCKACGKCITVRGGEVVAPQATGPRVKDWRTE